MDLVEMEWYYVDMDGEAKGPITTEDVKELPLDVFVWNGSTVNQWTELKEILSLIYHDNDEQNDYNNNVHCKPKLKNYWSISKRAGQINVESPSISIIPKNDLDFSKRAIPENNPVEIKSNLAQQLQNISIQQDDSPTQVTQEPQSQSQSKSLKSRLDIKQSVTDIISVCPPLFSPDDVVTDKLEQIMKTLQMTEHARIAMRDMSENKKLQMILEYDFAQKSEILLKKKNVNKKKRSLFNKKNKKKKSVSNSKSKEWKYGFNPLPIMIEQDEISSTIQSSMSFQTEQKDEKVDDYEHGYLNIMKPETSVNSNNSNNSDNNYNDESYTVEDTQETQDTQDSAYDIL